MKEDSATSPTATSVIADDIVGDRRDDARPVRRIAMDGHEAAAFAAPAMNAKGEVPVGRLLAFLRCETPQIFFHGRLAARRGSRVASCNIVDVRGSSRCSSCIRHKCNNFATAAGKVLKKWPALADGDGRGGEFAMAGGGQRANFQIDNCFPGNNSSLRHLKG